MVHILSIFYKFNNILLTRVRNSKAFYWLVIVIFSAIMLIFTCFLEISADLTFEHNTIELSYYFCMLVLLEIVFVVNRFVDKSMLLPFNIQIFPISKSIFFKIFIIASFIDPKSLIVLLSSLPVIYRLYRASGPVGILGFPVIMLYYFAISIIIFYVYLLGYNFFNKNHKNISITYSIIYLLFMIVVFYKQEILFSKLPVIGWAILSTSYLLEQNWIMSSGYAILLFIFVTVLWLAGPKIYKRVV